MATDVVIDAAMAEAETADEAAAKRRRRGGVYGLFEQPPDGNLFVLVATYASFADAKRALHERAVGKYRYVIARILTDVYCELQEAKRFLAT